MAYICYYLLLFSHFDQGGVRDGIEVTLTSAIQGLTHSLPPMIPESCIITADEARNGLEGAASASTGSMPQPSHDLITKYQNIMNNIKYNIHISNANKKKKKNVLYHV